MATHSAYLRWLADQIDGGGIPADIPPPHPSDPPPPPAVRRGFSGAFSSAFRKQ